MYQNSVEFLMSASIYFYNSHINVTGELRVVSLIKSNYAYIVSVVFLIHIAIRNECNVGI